MYTVELKPKARKFIKELPEKLQRQILERIRSLKQDPRPKNYTLLHSTERLYRIRSGTYRIIYQIDDEHKLVTVAWVLHRRDAYKPLDR